MPNLNDFRALGELLPPNFQVGAADAAKVLSGIAAFVEHGDPLVEAAHLGLEGVHSFFHDLIAKEAEKVGAPAPVAGRLLTTPATVVTATSPPVTSASSTEAPVSPTDFAKLVQSVQQLAAAVAAQNPPDVTTTSPSPGING